MQWHSVAGLSVIGIEARFARLCKFPDFKIKI